MEKSWDHVCSDGTDYAGTDPSGIGRDIVFHERGASRQICGLRVSMNDPHWWQYIPSILTLVADPDIPTGCGYFVDDRGDAVAFIIGCDVRDMEPQGGSS